MEAKSIRVFVAEDSEDLAALVGRKLEGKMGWHVVRAASLDEAQRRLQGDRFDLAIIDYLLPDGTGLDLLPLLRATSPDTPVLFLTGHGSEDVAMKAMGLGATDYMQKDGHLLENLPARLDALLARAPDLATAARVVPVQEMHEPPARHRAEAAPLPDDEHLAQVLAQLVGRDVEGAAIFDGAGKPLAALLPEGVDATRLGAAVFTLHAEVGVFGRLAGVTPRAFSFVLEHEKGLVAAGTLAGRALLAVLVAPQSGEGFARERLGDLAKRLKAK
ncbi:MAG: two-component system, OmpR family, response regulator QseB [Thermoplasmata archaeon]|jgi:DNA-binding response OmpR family regulator|nr:two-component system, OmpR family, response regulator QseB [Thermoplasmata archaeon]